MFVVVRVCNTIIDSESGENKWSKRPMAPNDLSPNQAKCLRKGVRGPDRNREAADGLR